MFQRFFDPWIVNIIIKNLIQNFQNFIFPQEIEREIKIKIFLIEKETEFPKFHLSDLQKRKKTKQDIFLWELAIKMETPPPRQDKIKSSSLARWRSTKVSWRSFVHRNYLPLFPSPPSVHYGMEMKATRDPWKMAMPDPSSFRSFLRLQRVHPPPGEISYRREPDPRPFSRLRANTCAPRIGIYIHGFANGVRFFSR